MDTQQLQTRGKHSPDVNDTEIAHLAGLLDAVGTVTVHVSKNDKYSIGYQYQAVVRVIRPMDDNDPILGKLLAYCDENGVKYSLSETSHGKDWDSKSYEWLCKNPESIRRFLEPMLPYLVTQYKRSVIMLEQIVPRMEDGLHLKKEGFYELMEFADMIRDGNTRGTERKYDQESFGEEWSIGE